MSTAIFFDLDGTLLNVPASLAASRAGREAKSGQGGRIERGFAVEMPAAMEVVQKLRKVGWRLGIISNGRAGRQIGKLVDLGMGAMFEVVVVSGREGVSKPDPRIFNLALGRMGVEASDAWFVGNDPVEDIEGARKVGMRAIWVSGGGTWPLAGGTEPQFVVDRIALLPGLVGCPRR